MKRCIIILLLFVISLPACVTERLEQKTVHIPKLSSLPLHHIERTVFLPNWEVTVSIAWDKANNWVQATTVYKGSDPLSRATLHVKLPDTQPSKNILIKNELQADIFVESPEGALLAKELNAPWEKGKVFQPELIPRLVMEKYINELVVEVLYTKPGSSEEISENNL
ncbi:hypothetical protein JCM14036_21450 [Desulfotomaculum defluvii]